MLTARIPRENGGSKAGRSPADCLPWGLGGQNRWESVTVAAPAATDTVSQRRVELRVAFMGGQSVT